MQDYPNLPSWYDQLGSLYRQHILNHLDGTLEPFIREKQVRVGRLSAILACLGVVTITLLHTDTEGVGLRVLQTLDFRCTRPRAILIEHKHLGADGKKTLRSFL